MFGPRVKINNHLMEKIRKYSEIAGYSSVEEFVEHALENELAKLEDVDSEGVGVEAGVEYLEQEGSELVMLDIARGVLIEVFGPS